MSLGLHDAMIEDTEYLQSPLDDLESFFWLACWAVLFNDCKANEKRSKVETKWQQSLRNADSDAKRSFVGRLTETTPSNGWSQILTEFHPLLRAWWGVRIELQEDWKITVTDEVLEKMSCTSRKQFLLYHFHRFALAGVKKVLSVLALHHVRLRGYNKFDLLL
jgi:hypothetical protein